MTTRVRPGVVRNLPVMLFLALGAWPLFGSEFPIWMVVLGILLLLALPLYAALVFTTRFEFGSEFTRISRLGRVREFSQESTVLKVHPHAVGFFSESVSVELRSADTRCTVSLAVFGTGDRERIVRELRSRFDASAQTTGDPTG